MGSKACQLKSQSLFKTVPWSIIHSGKVLLTLNYPSLSSSKLKTKIGAPVLQVFLNPQRIRSKSLLSLHAVLERLHTKPSLFKVIESV